MCACITLIDMKIQTCSLLDKIRVDKNAWQAIVKLYTANYFGFFSMAIPLEYIDLSYENDHL